MLGETLGPYRIVSMLGTGGMGTVYLAEVVERKSALTEGSSVALKVLHPHLLAKPGFFKRFLREAEIGKAVRHPNVVRTLDCDALLHADAQHHFIVMEYVEGQTLREVLEDLGRFPEELCRHVAHEVSAGLAAIHDAGVIHRDLKPENVLITKENVVKVMDLGIARLAEEAARLSQTGMFVGSINYAAPEQFAKGGRDVDGRADLFALGVLLYELSTGSQPHLGEDIRATMREILNSTPRGLGEVNPQISPFFEEVVHTLLKKDREDRFASSNLLREVMEGGEESSWWSDRKRTIREETRRPLRRVRIPRDTAVYGREEEMARLRNLFDLAKSGEGQVVLIEGEAGIGKTRLADEVVGRLYAEGADISFLYGGYPPGGAATAEGAFVAAYREHLGEEELELALGGHLRKSPSLIAPFAALLRGEPPPQGAATVTRESLQTAFVHTTRSLAGERPTIVLIDDLHFTSSAGLGLFASLSHSAPGHRVLLVGTARRGLPEDWLVGLDRLPHFTRLPLPRLGNEDVRRLLQDAFSSAELAAELAPRIAPKSDGNPYFVFELIRDLRDSGNLEELPDGTWITTEIIETIDIPTTVRDMIKARVSGLGEEEREILDVASCSGVEFDVGLVADALGFPRVPTLRRIAHLENHFRLVRSVGRKFVFDHQQTREVLYRDMPEMLREEYHLALANALESRDVPANQVRARAFEVCGHYLKGGMPGGALPYLAPALEHLEAKLLTEAAVDLIWQIMSVPELLEGRERLELLIRMTRHLDTLGRREEEDAFLTEAAALAEQVKDGALRARVLAGRGWYQIGVSRYEEARETLSQALDQALESRDETEEARACRDLGIALFCLGRYEEARSRHERHLELAQSLGDEMQIANATGNLGNVLFALGRVDEAEARYKQWLTLSREIGSRRGEAAATGNLGFIRHIQGRYEEAKSHQERSRALCREIGYRQGEARATGLVGQALLALGHYEESQGMSEDHLAQALSLNHRQGVVLARIELGETAAVLGNLAEARKSIESAHADAEETGSPSLVAQVCLAMGSLEEHSGHSAEAERHYRRSIELRREIGSAAGTAETLLAYSRLLVGMERRVEAQPLLEEAVTLAEEQNLAGVIVLASLLLGSPSARERFDALRDRLSHGEKMEALYLGWMDGGDPEHLRQARELLTDRVDQARTHRREAVLTELPLHHAIHSAAREHLEAS